MAVSDQYTANFRPFGLKSFMKTANQREQMRGNELRPMNTNVSYLQVRGPNIANTCRYIWSSASNDMYIHHSDPCYETHRHSTVLQLTLEIQACYFGTINYIELCVFLSRKCSWLSKILRANLFRPSLFLFLPLLRHPIQ